MNRKISEDVDIFEEHGFKMPSHLSTYRRRWMMLMVVAISSAFAGGPVLSWPTLEPLLINAGVWKGPDQQTNLTNVYAVAVSIMLYCQLIGGIWFDVAGPRTLGGCCCFICAFALCAMAVAIAVPGWNDLLWVAYPVAVAFGSIGNIDVYAWVWLLPEDQNLVIGLTGAVQCLSDSLVLVGVFIHNYWHVRIEYYFLIMGVMSIIAGVLAFAIIPPQCELFPLAKINALAEVGASYGAVDDADIKEHFSDNSLGAVLRKTWNNFNHARILICKIHPTVSCLVILYAVSTYSATMDVDIDMYPFYVDLVGRKQAVHLVNIFGGIYAVTSAAAMVTYGKFVDVVGIKQAVAWLNVPVLLNMFLYTVPHDWAQVLAQVFLSYLNVTCWILLPRWAMSYGPPELFGTLQGIADTILGLSQTFLPHTFTWGWKLFAPLLERGEAELAAPYLMLFVAWSLLTVVLSLLLLLWWGYYPVPQSGTLTIAQVRSIEEGPISVAGQTFV